MPLVTKDTSQSKPAEPPEESTQAIVPDQSRAERTRSFVPADFAVPHGREEDWRFTPVDRLGAFFAEGDRHAAPGDDDLPTALPEGVTASWIDLETAKSLGAQPGGDRSAAVAAARAGAVLHVNVPADAQLDEAIRLATIGADGQDSRHNSSHNQEPRFAHVLVTVGRHARATVVLPHTGSAQLNGLITFVTGDGAELAVVSLQEWDDDTVHLAQHDVVVGRDASVRHIAVTLGGRLVRLATNAVYAGPGGSFEGLGVYFADAAQHLEHRLFLDHSQPNCSSNVEYKGALQGDAAHTVWVGDVLIRAAAEGTDTYEMNRNLILTDGPQADSIPNLEIETGEIVGAGHASTTGRFDDEQLFYLMSRGIDEAEARRMIVHAFFGEVIRKIGIGEVVDRLMDAIEQELEESARLREQREATA